MKLNSYIIIIYYYYYYDDDYKTINKNLQTLRVLLHYYTKVKSKH